MQSIATLFESSFGPCFECFFGCFDGLVKVFLSGDRNLGIGPRRCGVNAVPSCSGVGELVVDYILEYLKLSVKARRLCIC